MNDNLEKKDKRVLGDEWKDWDGNLGADSSILDEKKGTFFIFSFFIIVLLVSFTLFFLYLITPRLELINHNLSIAVTTVLILGSSLLFLWYLGLILAVQGKKIFSFSKGFNKEILMFIIDNTTKLGLKFGISKDRMANSFLKVINQVTEVDIKSKLPLKPLIVLPRCLTKGLKNKADELSQKYGIDHFVVGGGQAALAILKKKNPQAVIGVACERDLLSGIKEVKADIPVIAISNRRPNGPCKNTDIDVNELERAIKYFMQI